jgi:hypothetical protein
MHSSFAYTDAMIFAKENHMIQVALETGDCGAV